MKRFNRLIAAAVVACFAFMMFPGCYGSYSLFKRIHRWNGGLGNKWVKTIVHLVLWIVPVYGLCLLVDFLILNTIEFWTGSNPMAMGPNDKEVQVVKKDGELFKITATQNRFDVEQMTGTKAGTKAAMVFDDTKGAWYIQSKGHKIKVMEHDGNSPDNVKLFYPDGTTTTKSLNEAM